MPEQFFCHASKKKAFDSAPTMRHHGNYVNFFLGSIIQHLLCIISVANMGIHFESSCFKPLLYLTEIFLCFLDNPQLSLGRTNSWESVGVDNLSETNASLQMSGQFLNLGRNHFRTIRSIQRNKYPLEFFHRISFLS